MQLLILLLIPSAHVLLCHLCPAAVVTLINSSLVCNRFCEIVLNDETEVGTETCWEAPLSLEQHSIDTSLT